MSKINGKIKRGEIMFANLSKGEKITMSIIMSFLLYGAFTFVFSLSTIINDFTISTFVGCLPYFAIWKLLICILSVIYIMIQGNGLDTKASKVGDGQYGSARFARDSEKLKIYKEVQPGHEKIPGFVVERAKKGTYWKIDNSDNNMMLLAPPGGGKTKSVLIPTIYYNGLVNKVTKGKGASMLLTDCKGELLNTCAEFLKEMGYRVMYLDFRYPMKSFKDNLMIGINNEIDKYKSDIDEGEKIMHYAKAERYAKTLAASIVENLSTESKSDSSQFFNDTSKGLITALILLVAEYGDEGERHIISVFKLLIELNGLTEGSTEALQKNKLEELLQHINNERILNFAGASMKADVRTSMNIFSSALGKLVSFIDAELEQMVCDHSPELNEIDFIKQPTAIFLVCPDENTTRHFFASLYIRNTINELIAQAEENHGILNRKVMCLWDEFGNMPPIKDADVLFSAARSRGIRVLIAIQSLAQLEKTYSHTMAKIIKESCQMTMFSFVAPLARETAEELSKSLGNRTIQSGSISTGKGNSTSIQMIGRPLMTPDEIINMQIGTFVLMKAGKLPVKVKLNIFSNYLPKRELYIERAESSIMQEIPYLTSDKIKSYVTRKQSTLSKGMFD
jgi:type IV secretion system protein VirD4